MRIQDQKWHKETVRTLRQYPILQKRIEIINLQMIRQAGPSTKVTQSFGTENGDYHDLEEELLDKQSRLQEIKLALECLTTDEQQIVSLKYFQGKKDRTIYEIERPMSSSTFYPILNKAVEKIAHCLGYLG